MIRYMAGRKTINIQDVRRLLDTYEDYDYEQESQGRVYYFHSACFADLLRAYRRVVPVTVHLIALPTTTEAHVQELRQMFPGIYFEVQTFPDYEEELRVVTVRCTRETMSYWMYRALTFARFLTSDISSAMRQTKLSLAGKNVIETKATHSELTLLDIMRNAYVFNYIGQHLPIDGYVNPVSIAVRSRHLQNGQPEHDYVLTRNKRLLCQYFLGEANYLLAQEHPEQHTSTMWCATRDYRSYVRFSDVIQKTVELLDAYLDTVAEEVRP